MRVPIGRMDTSMTCSKTSIPNKSFYDSMIVIVVVLCCTLLYVVVVNA
jgi:hypothetical protein